MTDPNSIEEVIKKQKEQCVFCKIIKGEIPSEKVYEDEDVLAIMDINPATDGHVLVMPKEHYPIMPLIPRKSFSHLFKIAKYIIIAQKEAFGSSTVSLFIANGGIAGQQSTHFMIHLIPRSAGDNLSMLDAYGSNDFDVRDIESILSPNLYAALLNHAQTNPDVAFFLEHLDKESSMTHNPESNVKPKSSHVPTDEQKKKDFRII